MIPPYRCRRLLTATIPSVDLEMANRRPKHTTRPTRRRLSEIRENCTRDIFHARLDLLIHPRAISVNHNI